MLRKDYTTRSYMEKRCIGTDDPKEVEGNNVYLGGFRQSITQLGEE